jgi:transcriptional regulator with XRE-family HTH domain
MEGERATTERTGVPELTELGKKIEMLRIERGVSKQHLARFAGTSRQQLWRVMTGKSEMSLGLRHRLMEALGVNTFDIPNTRSEMLAPHAPRLTPKTFAEYVADLDTVSQTMATMPSGARGIALKRRYLDAIEDVAVEAGVPLSAAFFDLRRRVLTGDL